MGKMTFEQWMDKVDRLIANRTYGMTSADLADQPYRDWYDDGMSPKQAARQALVNEGAYDE